MPAADARWSAGASGSRAPSPRKSRPAARDAPLAPDIDMLDAATGRTRVRGCARPRTTPYCARAIDEQRSVVAPCPPGWTGPLVINILLLETQIKDGGRSPTPHHALKLEIAFCVRGVISPLLANIYLHEVLDQWLEQDVKPRLKGTSFMVRYADDAVLGFERQDDAERVFAVLAKRFEKYALTLHPQKTRLIALHRPGSKDRGRSGPGEPRSFDFLGFTLYWGRSRKGNWVVRRKTAKDRLSRALRAVEAWCRRHRHTPVRWQHEQLSIKLRGHYAYYGMTGNGRSLASFRHHVERVWRKWLRRRSNVKLPWAQFSAFLQRDPLPPVRVVHSIYRHSATL